MTTLPAADPREAAMRGFRYAGSVETNDWFIAQQDAERLHPGRLFLLSRGKYQRFADAKGWRFLPEFGWTVWVADSTTRK